MRYHTAAQRRRDADLQDAFMPWTCAHCGNVNQVDDPHDFAGKQPCTKCVKPRAASATVSDPETAVAL